METASFPGLLGIEREKEKEKKDGARVCVCVFKRVREQDFPGGPVAKILHSQSRGPKFDPWLGN